MRGPVQRRVAGCGERAAVDLAAERITGILTFAPEHCLVNGGFP